jgi:hypothetical protein
MACSLIVAPMEPADAPALLAIAREWGHPAWSMMAGDHGIVVRDEGGAAAFALWREAPYGFVVDELWCYPTARGHQALVLLARWLEAKVLEIARDRGCTISLGGIVRTTNPAMDRALERYGYDVIAQVRGKTFAP